jgi:bleomycin hydrolase
MDMRKLRNESIEREKSAGGDDAMAAKRQSRTGAENNERTNERRAYQNGTKEEVLWDAELRQALFENLTTQDDHLMHIIGLEKSKAGKDYFIVKNSWGKIGPDDGYIHVSESYFAINTISLIVPKAAISKALLEKLKLK